MLLDPLRAALDELEGTAKSTFEQIAAGAETVGAAEVDELVTRVKGLEGKIATAGASITAAPAPASTPAPAAPESAAHPDVV